MVRIAVLDDYQQVAKRMAYWAVIEERAEVLFFHDHTAPGAETIDRLRGFDVVCLMRERTPLLAQDFAALPELRLVVTTGMGNASIDLTAARDHGVVVCGTEMSGPDTAEFAWLAIMAVMRGLSLEVDDVRDGGWQAGVGRRLEGATLGLLGLGNLGTVVARYANVFGMELLASSENLTIQHAATVGAARVDLDELFERSDVVSIHLKLSERTRGLVTANQLALLGRDGYLVNTSRGPIVVEDDLVHAIRAGTIAGAAIDTWDVEPLPVDHPLRRHPRVLSTPHIAYVTRETYLDAYRQTVDAVLAWMSGNPIRRIDAVLDRL